MKENVELMLTGDDASGVLWERQIAGVIEKHMESARFGRQLCRMDRTLVGNAGVEILIPKDVALDATQVSEGASLSLQTPSFDSVTCKVKIWGAAVEIGEETIEASKFNLVQHSLENLGQALAKYEDKDILKEMLDWTDVSAEASAVATGSITTVTLAYGNVIEISAMDISGATATTTYTVDYKNGVIHFATAPDSGASIDVTYAYNASVTTIETTTAAVLSVNAIRRAIYEIQAGDFKPDTLIVNPQQYGDLLEASELQDASKFGTNEPVMNGRVARILGLDVFMTNHQPIGVATVLDRTKAMMMVVKKDIWTKITKEGSYAVKGTVAIMAKLWTNVCRVNDGAICMITGCQSDAELGPL